MACYHPIPAYQSNRGGPVTLGPPLGTANLELPCGKCLGCKTARATEWARRCTHEATRTAHNHFVTITYDDEHLPYRGYLEPRDLQKFIKRLRKNSAQRFRYLACGEYGETTNRPHYHAIFFGLELHPGNKVSSTLYETELLTRSWGKGNVRYAEFTPAAAAYIAQYSLKKQGKGNAEHDEDGVWIPKPFIRMSLRPAIGKTWLEQYHEDLTHGYLITDSKKGPIPRYYKKWIKTNAQTVHEILEQKTEQTRINTKTDKNTPERRKDAEQIHIQKKAQEKREIKALTKPQIKDILGIHPRQRSKQ
jgi:hypothetical protein